MPGLAAVAPPRRPARGRADELLICLVTLQGSAPLSAGGLQELVDRLAQTYYATPGSVTAALRSAADSLNQYLLERNLRNTGAGRQVIALLNLAALRENQVFLAHSGPTHTFVLAPSVEHFHDSQLAGRGLGLTRTLSLRYYQASITPGSALLFSPEPPANWNENTLAGSAGLPLDNLQRRLLVQAPPSLRAALVQLQAGSGKINLTRPTRPASAAPAPTAQNVAPTVSPPAVSSQSPVSPPSAHPQPAGGAQGIISPALNQPAAPPPQPTVQAGAGITPAASQPVSPLSPPADRAGTVAAPPPDKPAVSTPKPGAASSAQAPLTSRPTPLSSSPPSPGGRSPSRPAVSPPASAAPAPARQPAPVPGRGPAAVPAAKAATGNDEPVIQEIQRIRHRQAAPAWLVSAWKGLGKARQRAGQGLQTLVARLLPGVADKAPVLSPFAMAFIALAVPLVIVAIALVIYFEKGQVEQYNLYFVQAQAAVLEVNDQKDPKVVRSAAERALLLLDKADTYQITNESRALRQQAQNQLDQIDSIVRLPFQPAIIGDLSRTANITQIIATANDLYLLDSTQGRVLRATLTGRGYDLDTKFDCGPGQINDFIIGPIIDIVPLPLNNPVKAPILALDQSGNLLSCLPGKSPYAKHLTPPDNNWGRIAAFSMDNDIVYILDPQSNAIQVYASDTGEYSQPPHLFFSESSPPLGDVVDFVVNAQDLYLLHGDGHLTTCTFNNLNLEPTRCTDPAVLSDPRPGQEPNPVTILGTRFSQILYTAPPNPSIFALDPGSATIYQFSLRLNLVQLLRSQSLTDYIPQGTKASAFTVDANQRAFIAFGSRVFYTTVFH